MILEQKIWVEGGDVEYELSKPSSSYGETVTLKVKLLDGGEEIPYFKLHVGKTSGIYEFGVIKILNIQSYPTVGGEWQVRFTTQGTSDLFITPINNTQWNSEISFLSIKCGSSLMEPEWINQKKTLLLQSYSCPKTSYETSLVLKPGAHTLEFIFGSSKEYAHNLAEGSGGEAWWNNSWQARKQLNFSSWGGAGTENLTNFTLMVKLNSSNINYSKTKTDGSDLRFIDNDGTTILNYHIEAWKDSNNESFIWVKVPIIENTSTDYIWLYYNNPVATNAENETGSFASNYVGVWHLNGTSPDVVKDSTSFGNNGTFNGSSLEFDGLKSIYTPENNDNYENY